MLILNKIEDFSTLLVVKKNYNLTINVKVIEFSSIFEVISKKKHWELSDGKQTSICDRTKSFQ